MKKSFLAAALAVSTAIAAAQDGPEVTFTKVLDVTKSAPTGVTGDVNAANYVPGADRFVVSRAGLTIETYDGQTGDYVNNLDMTGTSASGTLGFFSLTATENGTIYSVDASNGTIWRWGSVSSAPEEVFQGSPLARVGVTGTTDEDVVIAFTGVATDGAVQFYSDTFPFASESFTFNESVDLDSKSGLAMNSDGTIVFTSGEASQRPIKKWVKTDGVWSGTPVWEIGVGTASPPAGPMAYDEVNDLLFHLPMSSAAAYNRNLTVYNGADGSKITEIKVDSAPNNIAGRHGAFVIPSGNGGTLYMAAQGVDGNTAVFYVYDYTVSGSSVDDWTLYDQ